MPLPWKTAAKTKEVEDSIAFRAVTSLMMLVGVLAVNDLVQTSKELILLSCAGIVVGSIVSYYRRRSNNFWIKVGITWGILIVAGIFFQDLVERINASIADARIPLTNMLLSLQALHCFDMPRRRDLNISALIALTLIASTSMLSRSLEFGGYEALFLSLAAVLIHLDCASRSRSRAAECISEPERKLAVRQISITSAGFLALTAVLFLIMPRPEMTALRHVSLATKFNLPFLSAGSIRNKELEGKKATRADGSIAVNPRAYFGFAEDLDLNYRGQLGDEIVLRVNSPRGQLWRGMAFDTFNGNNWTMSNPRHTRMRYSDWGWHIWLSPVPSFEYAPHCRKIDLTQTFYVESDQPNVIPVASVPYEIYFPSQHVMLDDYGSLRDTSELERDTVYTVGSRVRFYDLAALNKMPPPTERETASCRNRLENYLQLPGSTAQDVRALSDKVAGGDFGWFNKANKLCNYLRTCYSYDLESPPTRAGDDAVNNFLLRDKRGSCEHFASAFVILCRAQGIPARLVTGFLPGECNSLTGLWDVRMRNAHAWAEAFIPHCGWITFDPTAQSTLPPAFPGYEKQAAFNYLSEQLKNLSQAIATQLHLGDISQLLIGAAATPVGNALKALWQVWKPLIIISGAVALVAFAAQLIASWRRRKSRKEEQRLFATIGGSPESRLLLKSVLLDLERISIARATDETINELTTRAQQQLLEDEQYRLPSFSPNDLSRSLEGFSCEYDSTRFGGNAKTDALKEHADSIHLLVSRLKAAEAEAAKTSSAIR